MDWDTIRKEWRRALPDAPLLSMEELRKRDRSLWKTVRRRDLVETIAGGFVAVFFALVAIRALGSGAWMQGGFALLIAAWGVYLPFPMHRSQRLALQPDHGLALIGHLRQQRDAALAQARMLERVWLWYLTPPAIGLTGLTLARDGVTAGSLGYIAVLAVLYAVLAWVNRRAARTQFRAHAEELQRQIDAMTGGDA